MLQVVDLNGVTHQINNIKQVTRIRKVNGETTLDFDALPDSKYHDAWRSLDNESKLLFKGEPFIIKDVTRGNIGKTEGKQMSAEHTFFDNMINAQQYSIHNGSQTFQAALNRVFGPTIYNFVIVGSFTAQTFDNFGRENCLSLFQKVLERYGAEFRVSGNTVYLYNQIGAHTGFQWRYKHNIKSITEAKSTRSLATVIRGYFGTPNDAGVYPIEREYPSPHLARFGEKHAEPIIDERVADEATALRMLKEKLIDEPQLSQTIDFADLQAAGYDQGRPNEGDWGYIIYEPMDIRVEARIVEVTEVFRWLKNDWVPIKTTVTLSNIRQTQTDKNTRFAKTTKMMDRLKAGVDSIPLSTMDVAVRNMTRLMQNASTEVTFENGMQLISKLNSNNRVIQNSEGIFFSRDGGATPYAGFTSDGVVAEAIYGSAIFGVNIASESGESTMWIEGGDIRLTDIASGRNLNLNPRGMTGFDDGGNILFQANRTWVTSGILGTNTRNVYLAAGDNPNAITGEARVVHIGGIPGDGEIASYNYLPLRASGLYANFLENSAGSPGNHLYLRPRAGGEVRITGAGTTDAYYPLRAGAIYSNNFISTSTSLWMGTDSAMHIVNKGHVEGTTSSPIYRDVYANDIWGRGFITRSTHAYIGADGELRVTNKGLGDIYRDVRALGYYGQYLVADAGLFAYVGTDLGLRVTSRGLASAGPIYRDVIAAGFTNGSRIESKTDISLWEKDALSIVNEADIAAYHLKGDLEQGRKIRKYGFVIGGEWRTPQEVINGDGVDQYAMASILWKAMQQALAKIDELEIKITELESA